MTIPTPPAAPSRHALAPFTAAEYGALRDALERLGHLGPDVRFAYAGLEEPPKEQVLADPRGLDRRGRAMLIDVRTGRAIDVVVSLTTGQAVSLVEVDRATMGDLPQLVQDYELAVELVMADPRWLAALERRGVDPSQAQCDPLTAGDFGLPEERGRRMIRVLAWRRPSPTDNYWAHPIDGLSAYVDLVERSVTEVLDVDGAPVPSESAEFMGDGDIPETRSLKPLEISQPEGSSFVVDDHEITWDRWRLRIGFDAREGLTLHQLGFAERPVVYRASIAEMVVSYGDPNPARFWTNYFDTGEYLVGRLANSLALGCDCLGEIHYVDAHVADEDGRPRTIPNAICIHEEDVGILWKHTDHAERSVTRRARRLVISFFTTVGNYDYGFYWYLNQDGSIGFEAKLNGIVFTIASSDPRYASELAPGLSAPFHQHLFCARLDMQVDGVRNRVDQAEAVRLPMGPGNAHGNAFTRRVEPITNESDAARNAEGAVGRHWVVRNPDSLNRLGQEVGYALLTEDSPTLMAAPDSPIAGRATFATKHLWVTAYDHAERYPAGDYVNQSPAGQGLPAYQAAGRDLDGADVVLWHTFGATHFPRTEDWPVMPLDHAGFTLRPYNFFDRNPGLDVAAPTPAACSTQGSGHGACGAGCGCHD